MKVTGIFLLLLAFMNCGPATTKTDQTMENQNQATAPQSIYDFEFNTLLGEKINLNEFKGRKMLLVNVASECGYTPQYKELQALYDKYGGKVVVIGFPANDFGGQEPGSNEQIASFCEKNYGVKFPIAEKIAVTGENRHPLYTYLASKELNGVTNEAPNWNFCKYLISERGAIIKFFPSKVSPMSEEIIAAINQ